jgi:hypothetical protein
MTQWATGGVGRAAIEGIFAQPDLELVGSWVHGEAKDGIDVGTLVGAAPIGVAATRDVDALGALGGGFGQSLRMMAEELGLTLDAELRATHETAAATEPIDTPIGPIEPGTVAAQRFRWEGPVDGGAVIPARS